MAVTEAEKRGREYGEAKISDQSRPRKLTEKGISEMNQPTDDCPDGKIPMYAVAMIDCVEVYGTGLVQQREARRTLYLSADLTKAAEFITRKRFYDHEDVPAVKYLDRDSDVFGEPSEGTQEIYAPVVQRHLNGGEN